MKYRKYSAKNPTLTKKALDYIIKNGRNEFDAMIEKLIEEHKSPTKLGWITKKKERINR